MEVRILSQEERKEKYEAPHFATSLSQQNLPKGAKQKSKFTDEIFPPEETSIYTDKSKYDNEKELPNFIKAQMKNQKHLEFGKQTYPWKRLSDIYKTGELNIIKEPPNIKQDPAILTEDVVQGEIGDCYFLSVLSSFAENPNRIKNFFPSLQISPNGIFEARVYLHGEPVNIAVDDYFPCREKEDGSFVPAFTGINRSTNNIWPMILEKIWAKVNFTYENIIAGVPSDAFEFLCPCPIDDYFHNITGEHIFESILEADQKNFIITCAITPCENQNLKELARMGLITNHAYSIIKAFEFLDSKGNTIKLLKIRNPWASNEWKGDWSDISTKWTPEIKELVGYSEKDDGIFHICIEDYLKYYTITSIAHYYDNHFFVSGKYTFNSGRVYNFVNVKVPYSGNCYFLLNQKNKRIYRNTKGMKDFENRQCNMILFRRNKENNFEYVSSISGHDNRLYFNADLTAGTYVVAVSFPCVIPIGCTSYESFQEGYVERLENTQLSFRLGVYSNIDKVTMSIPSEKELNQLENFLSKIAFDRASNDPNKYIFINEGEKNAWRSIVYEENSSSFGFICYNNPGDVYIHERITLNMISGINIIPILGASNERLESNGHEIEDPIERKSAQILKKKSDASIIKYIRLPTNQRKSISPTNKSICVMFDVQIAPHSVSTIILEKNNSDSAVEIDSNILLTYPLHVLLNETKTFNKKTRIKYENKFVEIFEIISESSRGVIFKYKNRTKDLNLKAHVKFTYLKNLLISTRSEEIRENDETPQSETENLSNIKDRSKEVEISVDPGHTVFFELCSIELFDTFSYGVEVDYVINFTKN